VGDFSIAAVAHRDRLEESPRPAAGEIGQKPVEPADLVEEGASRERPAVAVQALGQRRELFSFPKARSSATNRALPYSNS